MRILRHHIPASQLGTIIELPQLVLGVCVQPGIELPCPGIALFNSVSCRFVGMDEQCMFLHGTSRYWASGRLIPSEYLQCKPNPVDDQREQEVRAQIISWYTAGGLEVPSWVTED